MERRKWLRALQKKVAHLLLSEWDPIGVYPGGRDEYDAYASRVCSLLSLGASEADVADCLQRAAKEQMGLDSPPVDQLLRKLLQLLDP